MSPYLPSPCHSYPLVNLLPGITGIRGNRGSRGVGGIGGLTTGGGEASLFCLARLPLSLGSLCSLSIYVDNLNLSAWLSVTHFT